MAQSKVLTHLLRLAATTGGLMRSRGFSGWQGHRHVARASGRGPGRGAPCGPACLSAKVIQIGTECFVLLAGPWLT